MAQIFVSTVAHFFVSASGSKFHERMAHFFIDIYNGDRFSVTAEPTFVKGYMKTLANRGF